MTLGGIVAATVGQRRPPSRHLVRFYDTDDELLDMVVDYARSGLHAGDAVLLVAIEAHRAEITRRLGPDAASDRLVLLDAAATLQSFLVDGWPDPELFDDTVGRAVRAASAGRPIQIFGEMVALLWADGAVTSALELERLWNDLGRRMPFTLLCAYPQTAMLAGPEWIVGVLAEHHASAGPAHRTDGRVSRAFAHSPLAPSAARSFVMAELVERGDVERYDDIALVTSELVANVVRHTDTDATVTVEFGAAVRVCVADASPRLPHRIRPGNGQSSGRGLGIVERVADEWGAEATPDGKLVWATFARAEPLT